MMMMIVRILPNDNFPDLLTSVVAAYLQDGESAFTSQRVTDRLLSNGSPKHQGRSLSRYQIGTE